MRAMNCMVSAALVLACAAGAFGAPRDGVTFNGVISDGPDNGAGNSVLSNVFSGTYAVGKVRVSGTLRELNTSTRASEARIRVTTPAGRTFVLQPFTVGGFEGTVSVSDYVFTMPVVETSAAGQWTFRFFESVDDSGPDAQWDTVTITLDDEVPPPPPSHEDAVDLGDVEDGTLIDRSDTTTGTKAYQWYKFNLTVPVNSDEQRFLDMDSNATIFNTGSTDTEMAIFNDQGVLIAQDDDQGAFNSSLLSHGHDTRGGEYDGQDPDLAAGIYYVVIAPYNATFANGFVVNTSSNATTINARLRLTCGIDDVPGASAPQAEDLGELSPTGAKVEDHALGRGGVAWFTFTLLDPVDGEQGVFLDLDTESSVLSPQNDTELALYDASGNRIAWDDNDGFDRLSALSFGSGSTSSPNGDGLPYDGRDGALLPAGVYYVAVSGFNTEHGLSEWAVSSISNNTGVFTLVIRTNVSEVPPPPPTCPADFNDDGFLDFFDLDAYLICFEEIECPEGKTSDFNEDGFTDFFDLDAFLEAFDAGCDL
ncbi:MAG: hypothetical protein HRU70_00900 [Phycisphaeraceae bacterium]|nr:MAG: hypothetical protein HRU70_00900 [Phycisphaeraceae bacterium]